MSLAAGHRADTVDAFLGGRVEAVQADDGRHRAGLEALLLSAAIEPAFTGTVVDLGAGVGVAGMCIAQRCRNARVVLVDRDAGALALARAALGRPANRAFANRVAIVAADVTASEDARAAAGLGRAFADAVVMNPPFHRAEDGTASPAFARAEAHVLAGDGLEPWLRTATSIMKPGGRLVVIFRADAIDALLAALAGRFGAVAIMPIHPRHALAAHRVLVRAFKGTRARPALLQGLTLHGETGSTYLPPVEMILRDGMSLAEAHPAWANGTS